MAPSPYGPLSLDLSPQRPHSSGRASTLPHAHHIPLPLPPQAAYFMKSVLARANMENADLSDALMDRAVIVDSNLRGAILQVGNAEGHMHQPACLPPCHGLVCLVRSWPHRMSCALSLAAARGADAQRPEPRGHIRHRLQQRAAGQDAADGAVQIRRRGEPSCRAQRPVCGASNVIVADVLCSSSCRVHRLKCRAPPCLARGCRSTP